MWSSRTRAPRSACVIVALVAALGACSDGDGGSSGSSTSVLPPASITFPPPVSAVATDTLTVHGTTAPQGAVREVRVNGVPATTADNYAHWQARIPLVPGTNQIVVSTVALDGMETASAAAATLFQGSEFRQLTGVAVDSARNRVLLVDASRATLVSYNPATGLTKDLAVIPRWPDLPSAFTGQMTIDPVNSRAYIVQFTLVAVVDLVTDSLMSPLGGRGGLPGDLAIEPAGNLGYMSLAYEPVEFFVGNRVMRVDLMTLTQTELSGPNVPDTQNQLNQPYYLGLDVTRNRVLATDAGPPDAPPVPRIVAVDVTTGSRSILASPTVPNGSNPLVAGGPMVVDAARNRALVLDPARRAISAMDLTTGVFTTFSDATTPDANQPFQALGSIALDPANQRLLVTDPSRAALVTVDLATGARNTTTILGAGRLPTVSLSPGGPEQGVIVVDGERNRALNVNTGGIVAVDLDSGARTVLFVSDWLRFPTGAALDAERDLILVVDSGGVAAFDLRTGGRTDLIQPGSGALQYARDIVLDRPRGRALIVDSGRSSVIAADLASGATTLLSGPGKPDDLNLLSFPYLIALDAARGRALVVDSPGKVLAVDLASGARTVLASVAFSMVDFAVDARSARAVGVDSSNRLMSIDLASGAQAVLSDGAATGSGDPWAYPRAVAEHPTRGYWLVPDGFGRVFAVQPESGMRVVFSR
jgi:PQQ-like domain